LKQIQVRAIFPPSRRRALRDGRPAVASWKFSQFRSLRNKIIMKLILASLIASAAAFAPASQKATSTTSLNAFEGEVGKFSMR
jgi:hypothetical protein